MRIAVVVLVAFIVTVNLLTFGPHRVEALHDYYCWGKIDSVTLGC